MCRELKECKNYLEECDYERAIKAGKRAVKLCPDSFEAHLCLGKAYCLNEQPKPALSALKRAKDLASSKEELAEVYSWLGFAYSMDGKLEEALSYNEKSLSLYDELGNRREEKASILANMASIYEAMGERDRAIQYYEQALELTEDEGSKASIYNNMAVVYKQMKDYQRAIEYLNEAIRLDMNLGNHQEVVKSMLNLGSIYEDLQDFQEAERLFKEALSIVQELGDQYWEARSYTYLGNLESLRGNTELAIEYMQRAYELFKAIGAEDDACEVLAEICTLPSSPYREISLCNHYIETQNYEEAVEVGKKAVDLYPDNFYAYFHLGRAHYLRGEFGAALLNFNSAVELASCERELAYAYSWLGHVEMRLKKYTEALEYYTEQLSIERKLESREGEINALSNLAALYTEVDDFDQALELYEQALNLTYEETKTAGIYNNIGALYAMKEDYEKAIECYNKAIEISKKVGDEHGVAMSLIGLGGVYRGVGDLNRARELIERGLQIVRRVGDRYWEAAAYEGLGKIEKALENEELAKEYLRKACELYESIGAYGEAENVFEELSELEEDLE